jgi:hypothetical protein
MIFIAFEKILFQNGLKSKDSDYTPEIMTMLLMIQFI